MLLIITDGEISDLERTIDALVEVFLSSPPSLPLSLPPPSLLPPSLSRLLFLPFEMIFFLLCN